MTRSLTLREASFHDYPQITDLQARYGLETRPFEDWKHLWLDNPARRGHESELPIGWVLEGENNSIGGYLGNIPLYYELEGQRIVTAVAHSWVVETQYRSYALSLLEEYYAQDRVQLFLNNTVGPAASASFGVFDSLRVPAGKWNLSTFWITNYRGFTQGWLERRRLRLSKPVVFVISVAAYFRDLFRRSTSRWHSSSVEIQEYDHFDPRFDVFWNQLRTRRSHVLRAVRDCESLNWHFQDAIRQKRVWIFAGTNACGITCYGIFLRQDNAKYHLKRMRYIDFQTIDGNTELFLPMLRRALERCRREGFHMLECIGFGADKLSQILKTRPNQRELPSWLYYYKAKDPTLAERLSDPKVWDPSQFDGDASV